MTKTTDLSEARRALLEKYLRGELTETAIATHNGDVHPLDSSEARPGTVSRVSLVTVRDSGSRLPFFYIHVHCSTGFSVKNLYLISMIFHQSYFRLNSRGLSGYLKNFFSFWKNALIGLPI